MKKQLKAFVERHPGGWNHDEWLGLLAELGKSASDSDTVGKQLEKMRLEWELDQRAVPGLGPKRRAALVDRFESLWQLRSASVDEVAATPSITKALAVKVLESLH